MKNIYFIQMYLANITKLPIQTYKGLQLILVLKGHIKVQVNTKEYQLGPSHLILLNPQDIFSITGDDLNIVLVLKIPSEYLQQECKEILQYRYQCCADHQSLSLQHKHNEIRKTLVHMMFSFSTSEEASQLKTRISLFQLLNYLLEHFKITAQTEKLVQSGISDTRISSVVSYIDENYQQDISLSTLSNQEHISSNYLSRLFKEQVGIGFLDYLNIKRIESALKDLSYTDKSILTIALHNGFANSNAFIMQFKKMYNQTPQTFRQTFHNKEFTKVNGQNQFSIVPIDEIGNLPELIEYIRLYDQKNLHAHHNCQQQNNIAISLDQRANKMEVLEKIINIGLCSEALKSETYTQLVITQEKLNCQFILFQGVFCDGMPQIDYHSMYSFHEYNQIIISFKKLNLIPFIQLNVSDLILIKDDVANAGLILATFLQNMSKYFSKNYVESWKFDVVANPNISEEKYLLYYTEFYHQLKLFSQKINIGMLIFQENCGGIKKSRLTTTIERKCPPNFLTFKANPNLVISDLVAINDTSYESLKGYHLSITKQLQDVLKELDLTTIPLYLTEWNTLTGNNFLEAISFYRSALMIETVLSLSQHINGLSFWLSEYSKELITKVSTNSILSLFHCHNAKRAIFFTLQAFYKLGENVIFQDDRIIVTQNNQDDIIIMMFNPCLFNPIHSIDYNFLKLQHLKLSYELQDIEEGDYIIKTFNFTQKFTLAMNTPSVIHKIGDYQYNDEDVLEYVQNIAAPEFSLLEEHIKGSYTLTSELTFNEVVLYHLRKVS